MKEILIINFMTRALEHIPRARCSIHIYLELEMRAAAPVADEPVADGSYLRIMLGCVHEQKAHGLQWAE